MARSKLVVVRRRPPSGLLTRVYRRSTGRRSQPGSSGCRSPKRTTGAASVETAPLPLRGPPRKVAASSPTSMRAATSSGSGAAAMQRRSRSRAHVCAAAGSSRCAPADRSWCLSAWGGGGAARLRWKPPHAAIGEQEGDTTPGATAVAGSAPDNVRDARIDLPNWIRRLHSHERERTGAAPSTSRGGIANAGHAA